MAFKEDREGARWGDVVGMRVLSVLFLVLGPFGFWMHVPRVMSALQLQFGTTHTAQAVITRWDYQESGPYLASYEFDVEHQSFTGQCFCDLDVGVGDEATVEYVISNPNANCLADGYKWTLLPLILLAGWLAFVVVLIRAARESRITKRLARPQANQTSKSIRNTI